MGLFSRGPSRQDIDNAREFIGRIRYYSDPVIEKFTDPACRAATEITFLSVLASLCQSVAPKKFSECAIGAISSSFKYYHQGSSAEQALVISDLFEKTSGAFNRGLRTGSPLDEVAQEMFCGNYMKSRVFTQNPFILVEAKRMVNNAIENLRVSAMYPYKFPAQSLIFPQPKVFINLNKAPTITLTRKDGTPDVYFVADEIVQNHSTYLCGLEFEGDTPFIFKYIKTAGGGGRIEFISDEEFNELYKIYATDIAIFSAFDCPLY